MVWQHGSLILLKCRRHKNIEVIRPTFCNDKLLKYREKYTNIRVIEMSSDFKIVLKI